MDFQSETSNKEKNEPSPNLPNNEQSEDQLFFSPIAKFAIYNRFPFNLIIHFLLVIGTTYQLMIINTTYLRSQERSLYNSFRRFRSTSKGCDLYRKWGTRSKEEDIRLKAFEDDLKFLKGEIPYELEFDTIQEYFQKN